MCLNKRRLEAPNLASKTIGIALLACWPAVNGLRAQDTLRYEAGRSIRVHPMDGGPPTRHLVHRVDSAGLWVLPVSRYRSLPVAWVAERLTYMDHSRIKRIEVIRRGGMGRGALIGGLCGFAAGTATGYITNGGTDLLYDRWEVAVWTGVFAALPGAVIGGVVGASKVRVAVDGDPGKFAKGRRDIAMHRVQPVYY